MEIRTSGGVRVVSVEKAGDGYNITVDCGGHLPLPLTTGTSASTVVQ